MSRPRNIAESLQLAVLLIDSERIDRPRGSVASTLFKEKGDSRTAVFPLEAACSFKLVCVSLPTGRREDQDDWNGSPSDRMQSNNERPAVLFSLSHQTECNCGTGCRSSDRPSVLIPQ